jgi:hypothetical protein
MAKKYKPMWMSGHDPRESVQIAYDKGELIIPAQNALPPLYDEVGNPVWPPEFKAYCTHCMEWVWRGDFINKGRAVIPPCRPCKTKKEIGESPGAYTHVIKNHDTGSLYKISIVDSEIPKGYTTIYKTRGGQLLPKSLWKVKPYEPGQDKK